MTIFFTGRGDRGKSEVDKKKIPKDSLILETLGELDELNSLIGLSKNYLPKKFFEKLTEIQNDLFIIQANIAWLMYPKFKKPELNKKKIENLEKKIKEIEKKIKPKGRFVIYGDEKNSAWFDYLRSIVRKVERSVVRFNRKFKIQPEILSYLNRLSSYFYALARFECYNKKVKEVEPWY